jgi:hypothetical protein
MVSTSHSEGADIAAYASFLVQRLGDKDKLRLANLVEDLRGSKVRRVRWSLRQVS